jgi:membrane protease YdiL (CAAX protease family)
MLLLELLLMLIGAGLIAILGQKRGVDYSPSFGLLTALLMLAPFRLGFTIQVGSHIVHVPFVLLGIVVFMLIERRCKQDFFITKQGLSYTLLEGTILSVISLLIIGFISNLLPIKNNLQSLKTMPIYVLLEAFKVGVIEELLYRSFFLGYLRRFHFTSSEANLIQALYFTISHMRYLQNSDFAMIFVITGLGLFLGYITLRRKNVTAAMIIHVAVNMLYSYSS